MNTFSLERIINEALADNRYVEIVYNGTARNIYPLSFRPGVNGELLFAWCEKDPLKAAESFTIGKIESARVSPDSIYYTPPLPSEFVS